MAGYVPVGKEGDSGVGFSCECRVVFAEKKCYLLRVDM